MKKLISSLILLALCWGCQPNTNNNSNEKMSENIINNLADSTQKKVNNTQIISQLPQEQQTPATYFRSFPNAYIPSNKAQVTDAIKDSLLAYGITKNFMLDTTYMDIGTFTLNTPDAEEVFTFMLYKKREGGAVMAMNVYNDPKAEQTLFWEYDAGEWTSYDEKVPKVTADMFLREDVERRTETFWPVHFDYRIDTIKTNISPYTLSLYYDAKIEDNDIKYDIMLLWNGENFELVRQVSPYFNE